MDPERTPGEATALPVLAVLTAGPTHGRALGRRVLGHTGAAPALREGSRHPLPHALEARRAERDAAWSRLRRVHRPTVAGGAAFPRERQGWPRRAGAASRILRGVAGHGRR